MSEVDTGYRIREGSTMLRDRFTLYVDDTPVETLTDTGPVILTCATCAETLTPAGRCLNIGHCRTADRDATRGSLRRGKAQSAPAAWTSRGYVD